MNKKSNNWEGKESQSSIQKKRNSFMERNQALILKIFEKEREVLTEADMRRILGVDRTTLYRWRQDGILPYVSLGRTIIYLKVMICQMFWDRSD